MADISSFISWFVGYMISFFTYFFSLLDSISIGGFSLLDFCVSVFLAGLSVPLILVLVPGRAVGEIRRSERSLK